MDKTEAARILDRIQAEKKPTRAFLKNVPVTVVPESGNSFRVFLSMANGNAMDAARRLNDVGADIRPWPPQGHCDAVCTWDTMLHYLAMTGDLVFEK